jgi:hypothetical protein
VTTPAGVGIGKVGAGFMRARQRIRAGFTRVQPWGHWKCPECRCLIDSQAPEDWRVHQAWHRDQDPPDHDEDQAAGPAAPIYETFPDEDDHGT